MRLTELRNVRIRTLDGQHLGRVHEVHVEDGRISALTCGPGSLIEMLTAKKHGRRIPWECVVKIEKKQVVVVPDPPQRRAKKSSGSRSRQDTRRPSGKRSKR